jgi:NAD(P)H-flavin reductase
MVLQSIREGKRSHLFHSAKTASGLVYSSEFMKLEKESPLFKFHPTITGEAPSGWSGWTGRIGVEMVKRAVGSLDGKSFYLCGSKEMASSLAAALQAEGVPKEKIRKDEWG